MPNLAIRDLASSRDLDRQARSAVHGGRAWLTEPGGVANVNIEVNQNIAQLQDIRVDVLNGVGVIGAGFGPLRLNVSPRRVADTRFAL